MLKWAIFLFRKTERSREMNRYYISFIEECIQNPKYLNYRGGRIEVYEYNKPFASREIRFFTDRIPKFLAFRDRWDMRDITSSQLKYVKKRVKREFCQM